MKVRVRSPTGGLLPSPSSHDQLPPTAVQLTCRASHGEVPEDREDRRGHVRCGVQGAQPRVGGACCAQEDQTGGRGRGHPKHGDSGDQHSQGAPAPKHCPVRQLPHALLPRRIVVRSGGTGARLTGGGIMHPPAPTLTATPPTSPQPRPPPTRSAGCTT